MADSSKGKSGTPIDLKAAIANFTKAVVDAHRKSHAGAVIAVAAILNVKLERCLRRAMRPLSKEMYEELLGPMRPLGSLASKIAMAYALKRIDRDTHRELEKIRKIRSVFAHADDSLNLHSEQIAPLYEKLKRPEHSTYFETHRDRAFLDCATVIENVLEAYLVKMSERET